MKKIHILVLVVWAFAACNRENLDLAQTEIGFGEALRTAEAREYLKTHPHVAWISARVTRLEVILHVKLVNPSDTNWILPPKEPVQLFIKVGESEKWHKVTAVITPADLKAIGPKATQELSIKFVRNWMKVDSVALQICIADVASDVEAIQFQ